MPFGSATLGNESQIHGDDDDDTLIGTAEADDIIGYGGNDFLAGNDGFDYMVGGWGDDVLRSGAGSGDHVDGGDGLDTADYTDSWTAVYVDLVGGKGYYGTANNDYFYNVENVNGTSFDDTLIGNDVANVLIGFDGTDRLFGGAGNDTLYGLGENDYLTGGAGRDALWGGIGVDTAIYAESSTGVLVDLATGLGYYGDAMGDTLYGIENVHGSNFGDTLKGDAEANVLDGRGGNDSMWGWGGDDNMFGGAGQDYMVGGVGADVLSGEADIDTVSYSESLAGVTIDLVTGSGSGGEAEGDRLFDIENVWGSNLADTVTGSAYANVMDGMDGDDILSGRDGDDTLYGGYGNDTLYGGAGASFSNSSDAGAGMDGDDMLAGLEGTDMLYGGTGDDTLYGGDDNDRLDGGTGADRLDGGAGSDFATYAGAGAGVTADLAVVSANTGDAAGDTYVGIEGLVGSEFADALRGNNADNVLAAGTGNDSMLGRGGDDFLLAGLGRDVMVGGTQADTFDFNRAADSGTSATTRDIITDFMHLTDKIDLSTIDAILGAGNDEFDFIGTGAFTAAGQVRAMQANSHTILELNTTGADGAESAIQLSNFTAGTLTDADFLL